MHIWNDGVILKNCNKLTNLREKQYKIRINRIEIEFRRDYYKIIWKLKILFEQ